MAALVEKIRDSYNYVFYELADERTKDMFPSPPVIFIIIPCYLYFTTILGPKLMRDVKPFKLRNVMFLFNLFQIYICSYSLYLALKGGWLNGYSYTCQPIDMTDNPISRSMHNAVWWYTTVKLIDLLDTVFFVLRKKQRQISFLHVMHHSGMPIASYIILKYYPNGHGTFPGVINCIIHIVMYTYYLIAGLGPKYQKYVWWKKYLTTLQLVQFVIVFIHSVQILNDDTCDYPKWLCLMVCFHCLHFIYMFGSFYFVNYIKRSDKKVSRLVNSVLAEHSKEN